MKRILLALAVLMLAGGMAHAQTANVVSSCGTITYDNAGTATPRPLTQDTGGKLCTGAALSGTGDSNLVQVGGVNVKTGAGAATGALRVELPTNGTGVVGLNAGTNLVGKVGIDQTTPGTTNAVSAVLTAGSAIAGKVGIDQTTPGTTNAVSATNFPTTAAVGAGTAATALRVELPTDGTGKVGLNATQNSIGNVGGKTVRVCVAPTVTSATYGANVVMGGLLSFANLFTSTGSGIIQSISLDFTTVQSVGFKLYPFTSNPSNTTWTEHSAASINSADIFKVDPFISMTNYDGGLGTMTNYSLTGLGQSYSSGGTTGYFVLVPTATTATLGGTSSVVQVCVTVIQDL